MLASGDRGRAEQGQRGRCLHKPLAVPACTPGPVFGVVLTTRRSTGIFSHRSARRRGPTCVCHSQTRAVAVGALLLKRLNVRDGVPCSAARVCLLQKPSIQVACSLTYQSTYWGIRSIGRERPRRGAGGRWVGWCGAWYPKNSAFLKST